MKPSHTENQTTPVSSPPPELWACSQTEQILPGHRAGRKAGDGWPDLHIPGRIIGDVESRRAKRGVKVEACCHRGGIQLQQNSRQTPDDERPLEVAPLTTLLSTSDATRVGYFNLTNLCASLRSDASSRMLIWLDPLKVQEVSTFQSELRAMSFTRTLSRPFELGISSTKR